MPIAAVRDRVRDTLAAYRRQVAAVVGEKDQCVVDTVDLIP